MVHWAVQSLKAHNSQHWARAAVRSATWASGAGVVYCLQGALAGNRSETEWIRLEPGTLKWIVGILRVSRLAPLHHNAPHKQTRLSVVIGLCSWFTKGHAKVRLEARLDPKLERK